MRFFLQQILFSFRILYRYRLHTFISVFGLALAIATIWFIADFVQKSFSYDSVHKNRSAIYRISMLLTADGSTDRYATTGAPLGTLLYQEHAAVVSYANMTLPEAEIKVGKTTVATENIYKVNPEVLDVFSFEFLRGTNQSAFSEPNSILISRNFASQYFNSLDVIGKTMLVDSVHYAITGVVEDLPVNTSLKIEALYYPTTNTGAITPQDWFNFENYTYVLLDANISQSHLEGQLKDLVHKHMVPFLEGTGMEVTYLAEPLKDLYFSEAGIQDIPKGNPLYVQILLVLGGLVVFIAGVNYVNLTITRTTQRTKEIGVKKVLGITPKQVWKQNGIDACIMVGLIGGTTILILLLVAPWYASLTGFSSLAIQGKGLLITGLVFYVFILGLLGASYTQITASISWSVIQKEPQIIRMLKKGLLGLQFGLSTAIVLATFSIHQQLSFMKNKDLGFEKSKVLMVDLPEDDLFMDKKQQLQNAMLRLPETQSAALIGGGALPGEDNGKELFQVKVNEELTEKVFNIYRIDSNYIPTLGMALLEGRNCNRQEDFQHGVLVNMALVKAMGWEEAIGKEIAYGENKRKVIGVVKNFHNRSLHNLIEPIVLLPDPHYTSKLLIKTNSPDLNKIEQQWKSVFSEYPLHYTYFDQFIDGLYTQENNLLRMLGITSGIALTLCFMGLFAMFSLHVLQVKRSMGIRKVLGAQGLDLMVVLTKNYFVVALLSTLSMVPVTWLLLQNWYSEFSYKQPISPVLYGYSILVILIIAAMAMGYHVAKIIRLNPTEVIWHE